MGFKMNESIIAGLSNGGFVADCFALSGFISIASIVLWFVSIMARLVWKFVDEDDYKLLPWIKKYFFRPDQGDEIIFHLIIIPLALFILGGLFIVSLHYPTFCLVIVGLVCLMFVARYGRRTHKKLHEHIKDKSAH